MHKAILTLLFSMSFYLVSSQIRFEPGYYIDNNGLKVEGFIKNVIKGNNPDHFIFKKSKGSEEVKKHLTDAALFAVNNRSKYIRADVEIDLSSTDFRKPSKSKSPAPEHKTLFLKVEFEGKANLYSYFQESLKRFLYKVGNGDIKELTYIVYRVTGSSVGENTKYFNQLYSDVRCGYNDSNELQNVGYFRSDLLKYFKKYHECSGGTFQKKTNKGTDKVLNLRLTSAFDFSSLTIMRTTSFRGVIPTFDQGNHTNLRFGLEAEIVIPSTNNKWAFLLEPTYRQFSTDNTVDDVQFKLDYKSIEIPAGVRHNFFLNESTVIFLDALITFGVDLGSNLNVTNFPITDPNIAIGSNTNFAFGFGVKLKKFSVGGRLYTNQNILDSSEFWDSELNRTSIIVGYKFY